MDSRFSSQELSRRRGTVLAVAMVVIAVIAFLAGRVTAPDDNQTPIPPRSSNPEGERDGVDAPFGYEQSREGAVEAATDFTRLMAAVSDDTDAYLSRIEAIAAPEWAEEARRLAMNSLEFLRERYGSRGAFSFAPVRYRVDSYSDTAATISVWGVTVASGSKIPGIEESWLTGTLDLAWISENWRLVGQKSETGPTPELLETTDSGSDLDGFEEYGRAPSP